MIDVIKKTLLAGVGAAVITKEKVEAALNEFVQKGKVTSNEARDMADKIAQEGRREFETLSHNLNEKIREVFTSAERNNQERIAALEARVAALEQGATGSAASHPVVASASAPASEGTTSTPGA